MTLFALILFVCFVLTVPIAAGLGLSSFAYMQQMGMNLGMIGQRMFVAVDMSTLLAIPFFILAGNLMNSGGISRRIIDCINCFVGRRTGGFAIVTIVSCMFFAALSGSGAATTGAIGAIMIPMMVGKGYDVRFAAGTTATAAELGVIIPPSVSMILYCVAVNQSISDMFLAGFLPGILIGVSLMVVAYFRCKKEGWRGSDRTFTGREKLVSVLNASWALFMPLIILGGIYGGIVTPTEAAAVSAVYAMFVGFVVYRELTVKSFIKSLYDTAVLVGIVMIILSTAGLFAYMLTINMVPQKVAGWLVGFSDNKYVLLLLINVVLLVIGMFFDGAPAMIVMAPILLPAVTAVGVDPIHFGIIMVCNLALGMITPPFGVNLFVAAQVARIKYVEMIRSIVPYMIAIWLDLMIIMCFPQICLFLPGLFR